MTRADAQQAVDEKIAKHGQLAKPLRYDSDVICAFLVGILQCLHVTTVCMLKDNLMIHFMTIAGIN